MSDANPDRSPRTPQPGGEEIDQPLGSPDAAATPEGEVEAALTTEGALEAAGEKGDTKDRPPAERRESAAGLVAGGIFLSRIIGFVRERAIGYFFGVGPHADVFRVALRAPKKYPMARSRTNPMIRLRKMPPATSPAALCVRSAGDWSFASPFSPAASSAPSVVSAASTSPSGVAAASGEARG